MFESKHFKLTTHLHLYVWQIIAKGNTIKYMLIDDCDTFAGFELPF